MKHLRDVRFSPDNRDALIYYPMIKPVTMDCKATNHSLTSNQQPEFTVADTGTNNEA